MKILDKPVLVLNKFWMPIRIVTVKRACTLIDVWKEEEFGYNIKMNIGDCIEVDLSPIKKNRKKK